MKFRQENPDFKPITITLNNQEEVDILYTLLNYVPIYNVLREYSGEWNRLRVFLEEHQCNYDQYFYKVRKSLEGLR